MALAVFGLFGLGYWMVQLDYYSPYYTSAPDLHRSLGVIVGIALVLRLVWRLANTRPSDAELSPFERAASKLAHWSFYALIFAITVSGYLIATTDGRPVDIFGLLSLPSVVLDKSLTDTAGWIHRWLAYTVIGLAALHTTAALKHHSLDHHDTLSRMWSGPPRS